MVSRSEISEDDKVLVLLRDMGRCLACGWHLPTIQHRQAKGMGGIGDKHPPLTPADCVVLCATHNREAEGAGQAEALRFGWKVPRNCPVPCSEVPFFDRMTGRWWLPDVLGRRHHVDPAWAAAQIKRANGS